MAKIDFDRYAGRYDALVAAQTRFFDSDSEYFARYKIERVKQLVGAVGAALDFGCGVGRSLAHLREAFPNAELVGCDPSAESLAIARRENPACRFFALAELPAEPRFDLVLASCVFHHIAPGERQDALDYCHSRLTPGGHCVVFEHNPFNPVTRHLVNTCPFDTDAALLSMRRTIGLMRAARFDIVRADYCLFFPGVLAAFRPLENFMGWLPLGGQYFVCGARS
ncbi:MAG: class I SAM-dependent methyltransferase [Pseudolabrys sp.]